MGVCESLPEHCAILLCIEVHLGWVVLLWVRLVSTRIVRHPCEVEVVGAVFSQRRRQDELCKGCVSLSHFAETKHTCKHAVWYCGGFGAAGDLGFSRCLVSNDHT